MAVLGGMLMCVTAWSNPWTECGIGGAIGSLINKQPASDVIATISNLVWDLGTTATSSATLTPGLCANKKMVSAARFINDTYAILEIETVNGHGENLSALLNIVEYDKSKQTEFINSLRSSFALMVNSKEFTEIKEIEKAQAYYSIFVATLM